MTKIFKFLIFLNLSLVCRPLLAGTFTFNSSDPAWSFYGSGLGSTVQNEGRVDPLVDGVESLWLSCDWGEDHTTFYEWQDLTPGEYKVTYYLKAQDLQFGPDKVSLWNFYDSGKGTVTPVPYLSGNFNWKRVQYTIKVSKPKLTMWFRLKAPGQVWIDDFSLEKTSSKHETAQISEPEEIKKAKKYNYEYKQTSDVPKQKTFRLFEFNTQEPGHPFNIKKLSSNNGAGELNPQKFYDFTVDRLPLSDWRGYDRIEMDVFNPNENFAEFTVTLADQKSFNYWSQTNHKQSLAPGWNKVGFSLTQFVGERGSHRYLRSINLSALSKFHMIIDADAKSFFEKKSFYIDNILLSANPAPIAPTGVMAFDFTSHKSFINTGLIKVTTQTLFNDQRGYGFSDPQFWRVEDSQYASEALRYTIGLNSGHFKVKLPNGKYTISMVIDKLGYWDVPFWKDRSVFANEKIIFKETRPGGNDYLKDLLRFQNVEPKLNDSPFDLYLAETFKPIEKNVEVTDGILDLSFAGDASGIALNTLVIWEQKDQDVAKKYLTDLNNRQRLEFNWMTKPLVKAGSGMPKPKDSLVEIVEADLRLRPDQLKFPAGKKLIFFGGRGERPYQLLQLFPGSKDETFSWSLSNLINEKGEKIHQGAISFSEVIYQYTSPDLNHETYMLTGKFLKKLNDNKILVPKNMGRYLWMQLKITNALSPGTYKGELSVNHGARKTALPLEIQVQKYELPQIDFPVGFFGLDPLPVTYFTGKGYEEIRKKYRHLTLERLVEAGFTTFTGLPGAQITQKGSKIELDVSILDELFLQAKKLGMTQTLFSYGGKFPQTLFDGSLKPAAMKEDEFAVQVASQLKNIFSRNNWPTIVHTFSDEAGGYSDRIGQDIEFGKKLKKQFPFLILGGFGSADDKAALELNNFFDYGFYSHLPSSALNQFKTQKKKWGIYNASPGNFDDPRNTFGMGLFLARQSGLSHFLEWNTIGFNNYPYYEFDGREADVVLFYPATDGQLHNSLRFEFAAEGVQFYRKMKLLDETLKSKQQLSSAEREAQTWILKQKKSLVFDSSEKLKQIKKLNFSQLNFEVNDHLSAVFSQKI